MPRDNVAPRRSGPSQQILEASACGFGGNQSGRDGTASTAVLGALLPALAYLHDLGEPNPARLALEKTILAERL